MKYMGSKSRISKDIAPIINKFIKDNHIRTYIEPFCLSGDTIVYTENGIKTIKELSIGDYIYDNNLELKKIKNIIKSPEKEGIKIKTKGNVEIIATKKHIFYDENNNEIKGKDLLNKTLLTGVDNKVYDKNLYLDLKNQITYSNKKHGRNGKIIDENKIKLYHNAPIINRYIKIDEKLMFCYGLIVAEGDKGNITMHKNELDVCEKFIKYYSEILGINFNQKIYTYRNNSVQVSVPYKTIYEKIFFKEMNISYGARNKNISFLFKLPNDLVRVAINAMILGDGCIINKGKYKSVRYKTSSKTLAYQLQTLLSVKFNIKSTVSHGINKERIIENRKIKETDYYSISINRFEDIKKIIDLENYTVNVNESTKGFYVNEIEDVYDEFYDITLEDNSTHKYILNGGIVTHNCGGGNMIEHISCENKIGSDNNDYLISMWKDLQSGWQPPNEMSKGRYLNIKENKWEFKPALVAIAGFCATYNAKWFGGYAGIVKTKIGTYRDYYDESIRNILKQVPKIQNVEFRYGDYKQYSNVKNTLIYCDIPYQGTTQYGTSKNFNYDEFWEWTRNMSENNIVLISEYNAPCDFKCIFEKQLTTTLDKNSRKKDTEKLFIIK